MTLAGTPYGPASQAYGLTMPAGATKIGWSQFSRTSIDVSEFLARRRSIPNTVWFGSMAVTPEAYLLALANVAQVLFPGPGRPIGDGFACGAVGCAMGCQRFSLDLGVAHLSPGFHSDHLMELARLQAWTIKPAILKRPLRDTLHKPG